MAKLAWVVDGVLWVVWVLVAAHVLPAFGQTFVEQGHPLNPYSSAFVNLGDLVGWRPLTAILLAGGPILCWKLATRPNLAKNIKAPALVLVGLMGLWGLTIIALVLPMFV